MLRTSIKFFTMALLLTFCLGMVNADEPKPAPALKPVSLSPTERHSLEIAQKDLEILELRKKLIESQVQRDLLNALRNAGVKETDFTNYTFNAETFTFVPKK